MFSCYFCEDGKRGFNEYFCEECKQIQKIVNLYGRKEVLEILETTCLRNKKQVGYKIDKVKKEQDAASKAETDESYNKPPTPPPEFKKPSINKNSLRKKEKKAPAS